MNEIKIIKTNISVVTRNELEKLLQDFLGGSGQKKIAKVNTEFLLRALGSEEFKDTINSFDIKIADGSGVLWAAKYMSLPLTKIYGLKQLQAVWQLIYTGASLVLKPSYCKKPIPERFPGVDALKLMLNVAEKEKAGVYFFGAETGVLKDSIQNIKKEFPKINIVGWYEGYNYKDKTVIADINKNKPKLLIVALGSPKQEYWVRDHIDELQSVKIAVGEGGSLDFISGVHRRAPRWMQKAGIEWLWRLFMNKNLTITEKSRAKRIWNAVPVFVYKVFVYKIKNHDQ